MLIIRGFWHKTTSRKGRGWDSLVPEEGSHQHTPMGKEKDKGKKSSRQQMCGELRELGETRMAREQKGEPQKRKRVKANSLHGAIYKGGEIRIAIQERKIG